MITRLPVRLLPLSAASKLASHSSPRCLKVSELLGSPSQVLRYQHSRNYSTSPPPPPPPADTEPSKPIDLRSQFASQQQASQPKQKRSLRPLIYATLFLLLGLTAGQYTRLIVAPPPLPEAGSPEDKVMVEFLHKQGERLPIVQSLSTDPAWESYDAYGSIPEESRSARLTSGPLAGARALGAFQRVFYNKESGEVVTVIWFGGAISGWPGVVHGGVTSTVLDEALGRCAVKTFPAKTGVTANLEIDFLKPVVTNAFYVVRAVPQAEGETDTKRWVNGRLEMLDGRVCAEAKSLYVVPKKFKTRPIADKF
ncbi:putative mitochondrial protein [Lachnellula arida]|uniref:Putative mitochondrial protein n=1 Tax=Lachnellula arida TaxID=1316785 RepID=A0A8T9BU29_9HELO|nr:putative mitochondrial protein [Lachnellula arida]